MTHKQFLACLGLFYLGTTLQAQEISITETNADRLVEICILGPEMVPDDHRALVDFDRDVLLQISSYRRDHTPRNNKEGWQPYTRGVEVSLIDQYPSPERKLVPARKVALYDHEFLAVFQKDANFFRGSMEVILHVQDSGFGSHEFLFHYTPSNLFGEIPKGELCRRENNANNRIDVVLLNSSAQTDKQIGDSLDLERNVGLKISSYKRSYRPRNDKEEWQPAGKIGTLKLVDRHPDAKLSQNPVREILISDHEVAVAFPKDFVGLSPQEEVILDLNVALSGLQIYRYILHYEVGDSGMIEVSSKTLPVQSLEVQPEETGAVQNHSQEEQPGVYKGPAVTYPQLLHQTTPSYTEEAIEAKVQGIVILQAVIRKDGTVGNFKILRGLGYGLDERAIEEVSNNWRFRPSTREGKPVDFLVTMEVQFNLR